MDKKLTKKGPIRPPASVGHCIEDAAADWLSAQGVRFVASNFHSRFGELDLIGFDGEHLVFFEVRYRSSEHYGGAAVTVTHGKQRKLIRAARYFLSRHPVYYSRICRFDVIAVSGTPDEPDYRWHRAAFTLDDNNYNAF